MIMREILFRGKCQAGYDYSNGDRWVYGSLLKKEGSAAIATTADIKLDCYDDIDDFGCIPVKSNTVGQYTGLKDKNGTKIFEGDIIEEGYNNMAGRWTTKRWIMKWNKIEMAWMCYDNEISPYPTSASIVCTNKNVIEVIGNIYDNKSLLE